MPGEPHRRSEPRPLEALIRDALARLQRSPTPTSPDALVLLGHRQPGFPARVVQDPVLEPVDKVVWLVLRQHVETTDGPSALPSYAAIARQANVASPSTVSRALAILRATRWLSLCARLRRAGGQFGGHLYAMHEAPLPVADALHLDPDYLRFLEEARQHPHARVRAVVRAVLDSLDADRAAEVDRVAAASPCEGPSQAMSVAADHGTPGGLCCREGVSTRQADPDGIPQGVGPLRDSQAADRLRILDPQNSQAVGSSSCCCSGLSRDPRTTTTTAAREVRNSQAAEDGPALVYPASFAPEARAHADACLRAVPVALRQAVLDELEGRIRSGQQGGEPVRNPLGYLRHLCRRAGEGTFEPARGLRVQEERERRRIEAERHHARALASAERPMSGQQRYAKAAGALAEMRRILGQPVRRAERDPGVETPPPAEADG